jgi:hypothetical protein
VPLGTYTQQYFALTTSILCRIAHPQPNVSQETQNERPARRAAFVKFHAALRNSALGYSTREERRGASVENVFRVAQYEIRPRNHAYSGAVEV